MDAPAPLPPPFLARLAHELNTPLAPLQLQVDLLQDRLAPGEALLLQRNVGRLARLVRDIIQYCEAESGGGGTGLEARDLVPVVEAAVGRARLAAPGVTFLVEAPRSLPCWMDEAQVAGVVDRYLDNAVRHMPDGGQVRVAAHVRGDLVLVEVADQGVGFAASASQGLFQPFAEQASDGQGRVGGLGLSLYLCRRVVDRHGGHTWAVSPGPGLGATFGFSLRTASARLPVPENAL